MLPQITGMDKLQNAKLDLPKLSVEVITEADELTTKNKSGIASVRNDRQ